MIPAMQFPVFIWLRKVDYSKQDDSLCELSRQTPLLFIKVQGADVFPIFSTEEKAEMMLSHIGYNDAIVPCETDRLWRVLTVIRPPVIAFDPTSRGEIAGYALQHVIDWMQQPE